MRWREWVLRILGRRWGVWIEVRDRSFDALLVANTASTICSKWRWLLSSILTPCRLADTFLSWRAGVLELSALPYHGIVRLEGSSSRTEVRKPSCVGRYSNHQLKVTGRTTQDFLTIQFAVKGSPQTLEAHLRRASLEGVAPGEWKTDHLKHQSWRKLRANWRAGKGGCSFLWYLPWQVI